MTPTETTTALAAPTQAVQPVPRVPLNDMLALVRDTELVATYGREIIESQLAINRFDQDWRLARVFAESGLFADAQAVNQAMTKVQLGRSWHMDAADAMRFIYFVNGKPSVENEYFASKMRDSGLDWEIEWHREAGTCTGCTLWPSKLQTDGTFRPIMERVRDSSPQGFKLIPASVSFTKTDADRVPCKEDGKWIKLSQKSTYIAFPDDMYFWRSVSRLRKRYAPNVLSGAMMRDEIEESVEIQKTLPAPAPKEKLEVVEPITSGRQSRKKAGAEVVPGTEVPGTRAEVTENGPAANQPSPAGPVLATAAEVTEAVKVAGVKPPATAPTAPDRPWADHAALTVAFSDIHKKLGPERWAAEFGVFQKEHPTTVFGPGSFQDDDIVAFYRRLEKVVDAPAEAPAPEKKKLFG